MGEAQQDSTLLHYDQGTLELHEISKDDLTDYKEDPKFDYEVVKEEIGWWEDFKNWAYNLLLRFFQWLFGGDSAVGALAVFLNILPYFLLGILIYLLIRFFLKVNSRTLLYAQKNGSIVGLSEEEHIIKNEDIQSLIKNAIAVKDYRLAIRYYYLHILKMMGNNGFIEWEMQKTNDDYIHELKNTALKQSFSKITHLYDYIWYGNFMIDEPKFRKAELAFSELQKAIDKNA